MCGRQPSEDVIIQEEPETTSSTRMWPTKETCMKSLLNGITSYSSKTDKSFAEAEEEDRSATAKTATEMNSIDQSAEFQYPDTVEVMQLGLVKTHHFHCVYFQAFYLSSKRHYFHCVYFEAFHVFQYRSSSWFTGSFNVFSVFSVVSLSYRFTQKAVFTVM